jgi:hypothetical protein
LLSKVRDWLSDVFERLNNVRDRVNDAAVTGTGAVCGRELAVGGIGICVLPGNVGVCGSRVAGITGVRSTSRGG